MTIVAFFRVSIAVHRRSHRASIVRRNICDPCHATGWLILSDVRTTMTIVCEPCARRGRYNVDRLIVEHGDVRLTDLLATLADCPNARAASVHDRCKAVYEGL
jgi:hypothetical protein